MFEKLKALAARLDELEMRLSAPDLYDDPDRAAKLLRERNASGTPCENEYTDLTLSPDYFRPCQAERERLGIEDKQ